MYFHLYLRKYHDITFKKNAFSVLYIHIRIVKDLLLQPYIFNNNGVKKVCFLAHFIYESLLLQFLITFKLYNRNASFIIQAYHK